MDKRSQQSTLLSQTTTWEENRQILDDGIKYGCASALSRLAMKQAAEYVDGKTADLYSDRIPKRIPHNGDENFRDQGCDCKRSRRD